MVRLQWIRIRQPSGWVQSLVPFPGVAAFVPRLDSCFGLGRCTPDPMSTDSPAPLPFRSLCVVLEGDLIDARYRLADLAAVSRGEKVFMDCYQSACDFQVTFELPEHRAQLRFMLETGKYCECDDRFDPLNAEELDPPNRVSYGHDAIFGAPGEPDRWEGVAELPPDWPDEFAEATPEDDDDRFSFVAAGGPAAAGRCLRQATLVLAGDRMDVWRPAERVPIQDPLVHWPELQAILGDPKP